MKHPSALGFIVCVVLPLLGLIGILLMLATVFNVHTQDATIIRGHCVIQEQLNVWGSVIHSQSTCP